MEKQFNLDLELTKQAKTSTSKDGQSQSLGTPLLEEELEAPLLQVIWEEPDALAYFLDVGNRELTLHIHIFDPNKHLTVEQFRRFYNIFLQFVVLLSERGMTTIKTWVEEDRESQIRLAHYFGFYRTGNLFEVTMKDGRVYHMEEMTFEVPTDDH